MSNARDKRKKNPDRGALGRVALMRAKKSKPQRAARPRIGTRILISEGKYGHHILRHSAGTLLYEKSRDLKLVQGTLRHADISTTSDIYVHLSNKILNEGSEILAAEILGNCDLIVTQESKMVS
jgi:integrase/recombinase XerD